MKKLIKVMNKLGRTFTRRTGKLLLSTCFCYVFMNYINMNRCFCSNVNNDKKFIVCMFHSMYKF